LSDGLCTGTACHAGTLAEGWALPAGRRRGRASEQADEGEAGHGQQHVLRRGGAGCSAGVQLDCAPSQAKARLIRFITTSSDAAQLKCWRDKNSSEPPPDLAPPPPPMRSATPPSDAGPAAPADPAAPQPLSQRCALDRLRCCIPCGSCTVGTDMCTQMAACCTTKNMEVSARPASSGCCCHGAPVINV
jgi:hypothetical protein